MSIRLIAGDARDVLATLPAESVQCVVTSPPYYGLRDYGCAGQIGLEATPDEYLATMVAVFREVKRVLRPDGTCWVNMGDSYATTGGQTGGGSDFSWWKGGQTLNDRDAANKRATGAKPKDLLMMPARLALALQADGWWVRSDIIWVKPNPMPESCRDRPTSAHEHVFLITKSARYFYDAAAVAEQAIHEGRVVEYDGTQKNSSAALDPRMRTRIAKDTTVGATRSLRNVWTIATAPYSEAHFATFPPALAERCIKAGTSERGCCSRCGKPWERITDKAFVPQPNVSLARGVRLETQHDAANQWPGTPRGTTSATTTGWRAGCECYRVPPELADRYMEAPKVVPCTVLDPFAGAGTTLLVADRLQRDAIGIELNTAYTEMAMQRCRADAPLLHEMGPMPEHPVETEIADLFAEAAE
jgi:DNA modification methylase